jgi:hypothetical protein
MFDEPESRNGSKLRPEFRYPYFTSSRGRCTRRGMVGVRLILRSVSGPRVTTLRVNVRNAASGRSNDRPLGDIRGLGGVSPKNSQQDDLGGRRATLR